MARELPSIEVFQDLVLSVVPAKRNSVADAIRAAASSPWKFDQSQSEQMSKGLLGKRVLHFSRRESKGMQGASLTFVENSNGFYVSNVVPTKYGQLTHAQYNAILDDFVSRVLVPASQNAKIDYRVSSPQQSPRDWFTPETAQALAAFSSLANKSTGTGHPLDEERWFAFIVAAHRAGSERSSDKLQRWLEKDGWLFETALSLVSDYEGQRAILEYYDSH